MTPLHGALSQDLCRIKSTVSRSYMPSKRNDDSSQSAAGRRAEEADRLAVAQFFGASSLIRPGLMLGERLLR